MRIRDNQKYHISSVLRRLGYVAFIAIFTLSGAPSFSLCGLASTARTEHDAKVPISEEEIRIEHAIPEAHRCRIARLHLPSSHSLISSHTPQKGSRIPTRLDLVPRRALDKQNGIGAFLLC